MHQNKKLTSTYHLFCKAVNISRLSTLWLIICIPTMPQLRDKSDNPLCCYSNDFLLHWQWEIKIELRLQRAAFTGRKRGEWENVVLPHWVLRLFARQQRSVEAQELSVHFQVPNQNVCGRGLVEEGHPHLPSFCFCLLLAYGLFSILCSCLGALMFPPFPIFTSLTSQFSYLLT